MTQKTSFYKIALTLCIASSTTINAFAATKDTTKHNLNIVFIGNSITHGAGLKDWKTQAPPNEVVKYLKQQPGVGAVEFSNNGYSGHTTIDFLPTSTISNDFKNVEAAAKAFADKKAQLVFSMILGTNDSAVKGIRGGPVSKEDYETNLKAIVDALLKEFTGCKIVIQQPTWYSPNTHNGATYVQEGLDRLQSYFPKIKEAVKSYSKTNAKQVFVGDTKAFDFFKNHAEQYFQHEQGQEGIFYLHPNEEGAVILGDYWAKAIYKALF